MLIIGNPYFGPSVKNLEGKKFYITGYVIPVDIDEDFYVLSRYPFANCFFCGGAGPETVVDLQFSGHSPREYATDERLTFAGELKLNADDVYQMNYIIVRCSRIHSLIDPKSGGKSSFMITLL